MSAMPSPAQSEFYAGLLPVEPSVEPPPVRPTAIENDQFPNGKPSLRKRASRALARFLITFCIGVAATFGWQSYGDAARELIASSYPQLRWFAPQAEPVAQNTPDMIALAVRAATSVSRHGCTRDESAGPRCHCHREGAWHRAGGRACTGCWKRIQSERGIRTRRAEAVTMLLASRSMIREQDETLAQLQELDALARVVCLFCGICAGRHNLDGLDQRHRRVSGVGFGHT